MKSKLLILAMVLSTSLSSATTEATQTIVLDQQTCTSASNHACLINERTVTEDESMESQNTQKDSPKPVKKKRSTAGKIFNGFMAALMITIVVFLLTVRGNE